MPRIAAVFFLLALPWTSAARAEEVVEVIDIEVVLGDLGRTELGLIREGDGVIAVPGENGIALRVSPNSVGATARLIAGEDGLPLVAIEFPVADDAFAIAAHLSGLTPGKTLVLESPLLAPAVEPVGEGAPAARAQALAPWLAAPDITASQLARAGDRTFAHLLIHAASHDATTLSVPSSLRIAIAVSRRAAGGGLPPPTLDGGPVDVVIVTSELLRPEFEELAHFRTLTGLRAEVRTIEWIDGAYRASGGSDLASRIRAFLADARRDWGTRWVLLGGDTDIIPARYAVSSYFVADVEFIPADLYYAALDGDWNADGDNRFGEAPGGSGDPGDAVDLDPDLLVGRAPVSTREEARSFVARQIAYELGAGAGPDYPGSVLFLAERLFDSLDGADIAEEARQLLPPTLEVERLYESYESYPGALPETRDSAIASLDRGFGIVDHVGHGFRNSLSVGSGTLGNAEADGLTNQRRLPVFLALNCTSAAIDFNSIGERLVKNPAGGAIVYIGSSRFAFPSTAKHYQNAFFYAAFSESLRTAGEALGRARNLLAPLGITEGAHRWTQFALTLLGDPLTPVFSHRPSHLVLRHPPLLPLGAGSVTIGVFTAGQPAAGARVALLSGPNLVTGVSDAAGEAILPVPSDARGPLSIAATAPNAWPALSAIAIDGGGGGDPFLSVLDIAIDDRTGGDGDGIGEAGETVELRVTIENHGGNPSAAGTLVASILAGPGLIIDAQAPLPAVPAGGSMTVGGVRLEVEPSALDGDILTLELVLNAPPVARVVRRAVPAAAARIHVTGHTIDGDGQVDPGEQVRYGLKLQNSGRGTARAVTATARIIDAASGNPAPDVTLIDGFARFGDLRPGERTTGDAFVFILDPAAMPDSLRLEVSIATALNVIPPIRLDFRPPAVPTALRTRGSESAVILSWQPVPDRDLLGYEVERAPSPAGPFAVVTEQPLPAAFLTDAGLLPLTRFAYRVVAVDSSGNRSPVSVVVEGTTNPGVHPGWPVGMGQETASSPILADLDGDGAAEIVTGADAIYVWHGDASELRDGDGDAVTSGVFTGDGSDPIRGFHAVPAVADLDGDGEPEIVAVAWQAAQVFAWHLNGSRLAGWPRSLIGPPNWGSPAIADLDGDGSLEVAVLGGDAGDIFAWHSDGRELRDGDNDPSTDGVLLATGAAFSFATPALGDLDGGGDLELVIGLDELQGRVHALKAAGGEAPGFPVTLGGRISASPALGDLDGDGQLEVVIAVEDDSVHVLTSRGAPRPGWPQWAFLDNPSTRTSSPVLADLDGDGRPEIILAENSAPPPAQHLARLRAWRADGSVVPGFENVLFATDPEATSAGATQSTPVVGDVDGDGRPEILLGAEDGQLYGWNHDGTQAAGFPIQTSGEVRGSAALGDVDGDGRIEVVIAGWDKNLTVWDLDGEARADRLPWPFFHRDIQNRGNLALAVPGPIRPAPTRGDASLAESPELWPPSPNPANPNATFRFLLRHQSQVRLTLFTADGRAVRRLLDGSLEAGEHSLTWDGRAGGHPAPSGIYWLRLETPEGTAVRRLTVLR